MTSPELPRKYLPYVRNNDRWDSVEKIRTYILAFFLFPFRLLSTILLLSWYFVSLKIGLFNFGTQDLNKPVTSWRQKWVIQMGQPMARCLLFLMGFYVINKKGDSSLVSKDGKKANIIVVNHTSWLDILVMMAVSDGIPGFVAKRETQKIPYIGYKSTVWQCIYVDNRTNKTSGNNVTEQIVDRASRDDMPPILIFPEGTTSNGKYLIKFRTGAFVAGCPVKPCVIKYPSHGGFSPTWETINGLYHAFRLFTQVRNYCEVSWLPVHVPTQEEIDKPTLYADNVCNAMAKELGAEIIETTFNDKMEYHKLIGMKK